MSERLELARRIYERWERGDFSDATWAHPEIEFLSAFPGARAATGRDAMAASWRDWLSQWSEFRAAAEEYLERGDAVLVLTRFAGTGRGSGLSVSGFGGAAVFTIREGLVVRLSLIENRATALAEFQAVAGDE